MIEALWSIKWYITSLKRKQDLNIMVLNIGRAQLKNDPRSGNILVVIEKFINTLNKRHILPSTSFRLAKKKLLKNVDMLLNQQVGEII